MFSLFKTSKNEQRQLVERAHELGGRWMQYIEGNADGVIQILNRAAESQSAPSAKALDTVAESKIFLEVLAFHLHCADRTALRTLGLKKRDIFMEALFETSLLVAAKSKRADPAIEILFHDFYAGFELEHCNLEFSPKGLFYQFSKRLSVIGNYGRNPVQDAYLLPLLVNLLIRWEGRLCLSTFMNPKKSMDDWEAHQRQVAEILSKNSSRESH